MRADSMETIEVIASMVSTFLAFQDWTKVA